MKGASARNLFCFLIPLSKKNCGISMFENVDKQKGFSADPFCEKADRQMRSQCTCVLEPIFTLINENPHSLPFDRSLPHVFTLGLLFGVGGGGVL